MYFSPRRADITGKNKSHALTVTGMALNFPFPGIHWYWIKTSPRESLITEHALKRSDKEPHPHLTFTEECTSYYLNDITRLHEHSC